MDHYRNLVLNAGTGGLSPIIATPLEEWERILRTNLTGTFLTFKHAGAAIARALHGHQGRDDLRREDGR